MPPQARPTQLAEAVPHCAGQVQDVGLIFLSAIASAVVQQCVGAGVPPADTLATVLAAISLTTATVGIAIVCTGACCARCPAPRRRQRPARPGAHLVSCHMPQACGFATSPCPVSPAPAPAGALKLARLVQYIPLPVVGGYLSYVGLFVLESGEQAARCPGAQHAFLTLHAQPLPAAEVPG